MNNPLINEYYTTSKPNTVINDYDLYNFAVKILVPICMKYVQYAFWCKAKCVPTKGRNGNDLHRAAFSALMTSLQSEKSTERHKILCKIYNVNRTDDCVAIDYNAIIDGFYDMFASVIDGSVYYLPLSEVYRYQQEMGNACITRNGKFINIAADYFIDHAAGSYQLEVADLQSYNAAYKKYVLKEPKLAAEGLKMNKAEKQLLESISDMFGMLSRAVNKKILSIIAEHQNLNNDGCILHRRNRMRNYKGSLVR